MENSIEPRIIVFDLEVIPNLRKALQYWTQLSSKWDTKTLSASVTSICCAGWKVLNEPEVHCINAWDFPQWQKNVNDDRPLLEALAKVFETADAVVTHNGKKFDQKYLQTRLVLNGMNYVAETLHSDTRSIASSKLKFINNKLQTLGEELFGERKLEHEGWDLWVKTHDRDPEAMRTMEAYCKQDVLLLEKVFRKLRPFSRQIPNYNNFKKSAGASPNNYKACCRLCGSTRLASDGLRHTLMKSYRRLICKDCGGRTPGPLSPEELEAI